jgi:hypothetical protein
LKIAGLFTTAYCNTGFPKGVPGIGLLLPYFALITIPPSVAPKQPAASSANVTSSFAGSIITIFSTLE